MMCVGGVCGKIDRIDVLGEGCQGVSAGRLIRLMKIEKIELRLI